MPQLEMRTSERAALKRCVQQWYWSTVDGLAPNRAANPLWFGSAIHEGLASWYLKGTRRGVHPAETFTACLDGDRNVLVTNEEEEQHYADARKMGIDMLNRYVEAFGKDDQWSFIATEQTFQVLLPRPAQKVFGIPLEKIPRWLRYVGTVDGAFRDLETNKLWILENKTAASIRVDHLPLDDQAGSYWALFPSKLRSLGVLKEKDQIAGMMYNFLRKADDDPRPRDTDGFYHNQPKKDHYIEAINAELASMPNKTGGSWLGPGLTGKELIVDLQDIASKMDLVVLGDVSLKQPPPYFERFPVYRSRGERQTQIRRIQDEALFAEAYRNHDLPITKTPDKQWCSWCPFKVMCVMHENGDMLSVEEFKSSQYHVRDPYADHVRKSAES